MSQDNMFQGEIDPELVALIGADKAPMSSPDGSSAESPEYGSLFRDGEEAETAAAPEVDLGASSFPKIEKKFEATPHSAFSDPDYYKKALSGEGDAAQRVHGLLQKYVNTKDPKDRGVYRQQIITAYWDFLGSVARKTPGKLPEAKQFLLRFGVLHPTLITPDDKALLGKVVVENELKQPVYYLDEWLKAIGTGVLKTSMTDEVRVAKSNEQGRLKQLLDKAAGKREGARNLLKAKCDERTAYETALMEKAKQLLQHAPLADFPDIQSTYTELQKRLFSEIQEILKNMVRSDRELEKFFAEFEQANEDIAILEGKVNEAGGGVAVDVQSIDTEFDTVKQMAKLTIGRQGNHFPVLTREYFRASPNEIATRENAISLMAWIESIDPEAYCRSYKNKLNRIVPLVLLIPCYGDLGICWEPFDRYNRATSRGRIAVPMYPKNLPIAILTATADLRWQVAKEKASYYWMEEGLTGNYYQWFVSKKLKGDVKEYFIQDYVTWITKESDAIQRLEKEVRGIFWRYIPFSQAVKEKLKTRSYIYQELYQRDVNRSLSDGY
jgi:hypothetical protein